MGSTNQDEARADRAARNEAVFRRVNERLEEVNEGFQLVTDNAEFVCECASIDCAERVRMTLAKYEAVRRVSTQFIVRPGHVLPEEERVVEQHVEYLVVEKFGHAGERARQLDPRGDSEPAGP
jgi:hypothetical protein